MKIEALDNHIMGTLFEEVIRMFNEETNIMDDDVDEESSDENIDEE